MRYSSMLGNLSGSVVDSTTFYRVLSNINTSKLLLTMDIRITYRFERQLKFPYWRTMGNSG